MGKKEEFKEFVKKNPRLINHVKNDTMSWQKFYELFDLYGEEEETWASYLKEEEVVETDTAVASTATLGEFWNWIKKIDLDSLQEGVGNIQRVVGVLGDLSTKNDTTKEEYKPRPLYKHFDD